MHVKLILLAVLCLSGARSAIAADEPQAWLRATLAEITAEANLGEATVAYAVMETQSGKIVADANVDLGQTIASNVKLITAAAALKLLGPAYRFRTLVGGKREGAAIKGPLYVKGFGDPTMGELEVLALALRLSELGVQRIEGPLVVDDTFFDQELDPPLFATRTTNAPYRVPVAALSVAGNTVSARISPGDVVGSPARVILSPAGPNVELVGHVVTGSSSRSTWLRWQVDDADGRLIVRLRGRVRLGDHTRERTQRVNNPALLFASAFDQALSRAGIQRADAKWERGAMPVDTPIVVNGSSRPLAEIVREMNKRSDNFMAEQLLKTIGAEIGGPPGSWVNSLTAVRGYLSGAGIHEGSYELKNGSGLYESSRFSPWQVVTIIHSALLDFRVGPEFLSSLPIAGVDGTLEKRFVGSGAEYYVRAKTGTLNNVVALSGLAGAADGSASMIFSILIDHVPANRLGMARHLADRLAQQLVIYLEANSDGSVSTRQ